MLKPPRIKRALTTVFLLLSVAWIFRQRDCIFPMNRQVKVVDMRSNEYLTQLQHVDESKDMDNFKQDVTQPISTFETDVNPQIIMRSDISYESKSIKLSYVVSKVSKRPKVVKQQIQTGRNSELKTLITNMTSRGKTIDTDDKFLCMLFNMGRLGNQMYQYASLYGMAKRAGMIPLCDNRLHRKISETFKIESALCTPVNYQKPICSSFRHRADAFHGSFDWLHMDVLTEQPIGNVALSGYYQTWFYFYENFDDIRNEFVILESLRKKANNIIQKSSSELRTLIKANNDDVLTYVGVHVRHGDVTGVGRVDLGYMSPTISYYIHCMKYFMTRYANVVFIVTSDDGAWAVKEFHHLRSKFKTPVIVIEKSPHNVDFAILTLCNHTIMSVGTYGVWASFLSGGETLYFDVPVQPGSAPGKAYSSHKTDYYHPYWMPYI